MEQHPPYLEHQQLMRVEVAAAPGMELVGQAAPEAVVQVEVMDQRQEEMELPILVAVEVLGDTVHQIMLTEDPVLPV